MMWRVNFIGIKSMLVVQLMSVKGGESEQLRIDSGVYHAPWLFIVYVDGVMQEVKMGMERRIVSFLEDGRVCRLPDLLYADDLVLCGELEEDLKVMRWFAVCRRGLKVNAGKMKVMVLNGEEGLECEVRVDVIHLEHISELKYLGCVLDESGTDGAECSKKGRVVPS